jgi:acryloyl-coenzyme A reductase
MRAMVLEEFGRPMKVRELPRVLLGPGEVLIRVRACGLCGTDLKVADGAIDSVQLPLIPGHELAGEVVDLGANESGLAVGDHVVVHVYVTCGRCWYCRNAHENNCERSSRLGFERPGGFAEFVAAPIGNCYKVADWVPFEQACLLSGSVATPLHALRGQGRVTVGSTVVIFGVGGLGLHAVQLARELGGRVIAVDIDEPKLQLARDLGASATINSRSESVASTVRDLTDGEGADLVVPIVGGQALPTVLPDAFQALRRCGRLVLLSYLRRVPLTVDSHDLVYNAWEIVGSRSSTTQDLVDVVRMVEAGRVKPIVSRVVPIEQANEALDELRVSPPVGRLVLSL